MTPYIERAVRVLNDPEQTITAKQVAIDLLRNAGFSEGDIHTIKNVKDIDVTDQYFIFYA